MPQNSSITVEINGYPYALRGDGTPEELQRIADLVNQKIADIKRHCPHYSANKLAMMTALQIAEELLQLQDAYQQLVAETEIALQE